MEKADRGGRASAFALTFCLLAVTLTGCGSKKDAVSNTLPSEGLPGNSAGISGADEGGGAEDGAALMETLQEVLEKCANVNLYQDGTLTGTVVTAEESYPINWDLRSSLQINGEESNQSVYISAKAGDGYSESLYSSEIYALSENGRPVSYVRDVDYNWIRLERDAVEADRKISALFTCMADVEFAVTAQVEDGGRKAASTAMYDMEAELKGGAVQKVVAEYAGLPAEELDALDWSGITAEVSLHIFTTTYEEEATLWLEFELKSEDLTQALLSAVDGAESVENGEFTLSTSCHGNSKAGEESLWNASGKNIVEEGIVRGNCGIAQSISRLLDEAYEERLSADLKSVQTSDYVTLRRRGLDVTVAFPTGLRDKGSFTQTQEAAFGALLVLADEEVIVYGRYSIQNTKNELRVAYSLDSGVPEDYLEKGREKYQSYESNKDYTNCEIGDSYTIGVDMGQAQVLRFSYSDEYDYSIYYAAVPLESDKMLCMQVTVRYESEENICDDSTLRELFNHCSIGSEPPEPAEQKFATVEDYLRSIDLIYENKDVGNNTLATFAADRDSMIVSATYTDVLSVNYDLEGLSAMFREEHSSDEEYNSNIKSILCDLKEKTAVDNPKLIYIWYTADGVEFYREEYSYNGQ